MFSLKMFRISCCSTKKSLQKAIADSIQSKLIHSLGKLGKTLLKAFLVSLHRRLNDRWNGSGDKEFIYWATSVEKASLSFGRPSFECVEEDL